MYSTQEILTSKFLSILGILEAACDKHWSNYLSQTILGEDLHLRSWCRLAELQLSYTSGTVGSLCILLQLKGGVCFHNQVHVQLMNIIPSQD